MPSNFTKPLIVKKISARLWEVQGGFSYAVGSEDSKEVIHIPHGFLTDFASVPRPFWIIFPPDGQYTQSSVLHDFLYHSRLYTRKRSDRIFLEAMKVLKVSWWRRRTIYRAVRMFGWLAWKSKIKRVERHLKMPE